MTVTQTEPPNDDTPTPRWVKISGAVVIALVATFVVLHLTGHGMHGHGGVEHAGHDMHGHGGSDPQTP